MKKFLIETKHRLISCTLDDLANEITKLKCSGIKYRVMEL